MPSMSVPSVVPRTPLVASELLLRLFPGNLRAGFPGFIQRNGDGLLAAFDFFAAAGFKPTLFVLLHDFMDFGLAFTVAGGFPCCRHKSLLGGKRGAKNPGSFGE